MSGTNLSTQLICDRCQLNLLVVFMAQCIGFIGRLM